MIASSSERWIHEIKHEGRRWRAGTLPARGLHPPVAIFPGFAGKPCGSMSVPRLHCSLLAREQFKVGREPCRRLKSVACAIVIDIGVNIAPVAGEPAIYSAMSA